MTFAPINSEQAFLPTTLILPSLEEGEEHNLILTDFLKKMISAVNSKDIGQYMNQEVVTGQKFFTPGENGVLRDSMRKVIDFGALPSSTTKPVPHEIDFTPQTILTRIYATATDPDTNYIPIPYINTTTPGDSVEMFIDAININIRTTTANFVNFTTCYVVLEYIQG